MKEHETYNFNDHVTLSLTDFGVKVMIDQFGEPYMDTCHKGWRMTRTVKMELWQAANIFGKYMYNGTLYHPFDMRFDIRRTT